MGFWQWPALVANPLCPGHEKGTMQKSKGQIPVRSFKVPTRAFRFLLTFLAALPAVSLLHAQTAEPREAKAQTQASSPDLSGIWNRRGSANTRYLGYAFTKDEPPMTPWALERFKANRPSFGPHGVVDPNDPTYSCFLPGLPRIYVHPPPFEILQMQGRVIMLFEYDSYVRQIWTDGRQHPQNVDPDERLWMGDSIGHWEGDTLVVDTTDFNDKTWLDRAGHPHSEELHVVERIRRIDHDNLRIDLTILDPKAYTQPINSQLNYQLKPDWSIHEHACTDYPKPN
jgi:hypothetical protein